MTSAWDREKVIMVCGDRRLTRHEFADRVARAVSTLRQIGIGEGDCIGIALRNRPEYFELLAAAAHLGAKSVPIAWRLKDDEVRYLVDDSGAKVVFFEGESAASLTGSPGMSLTEYEDRLVSVEPATGVDPFPRAFLLELYSSGTTGRPKAIDRDMPLDPEGNPPDTRKLGFLGLLGVAAPDEVHMFCGPLYHSQPIGFATSALAAGHRVVMMEGSFDAEECLATIDRERVTWMTCVPTHLIRILALPERTRRGYDVSSIRAVFHSAAPCPRDVKARIMDFFPADTVWEVYGGTEGAMTMISPQEWRRKPGSVGRAFPPGTVVKILDGKGCELPPGELGLIYGQAPTPFRYRGAPELDDQTWRGELFTLGDIGYLDAEGYLWVTDRMKDMIITGGANVYPAEVEAVLFNHPAVVDVAVIGVPDPEWGESVKAIVETAGPVTSHDLVEHCRQHLAHYKCPKSVDLVERLPRDPNGKVRKRELREPFWAAAGRNV
jgi:long-chain acyl-CoA synthetase